MCGIFGAVINSKNIYIDQRKLVNILSEESQARGRDSSGFMFFDPLNDRYTVLKGSMPIGELSRAVKYKKLLDNAISNAEKNNHGPFMLIGHSRLVTNGTQLAAENNQPVIKDKIIAVHNGIIVNDSELWKKHSELNRLYEIDTEIYLSILNSLLESGLDLGQAIEETNSEIEGTTALALTLTRLNKLLLLSNNGSLYVLTDKKDLLVFASEYYPLKKIAQKFGLSRAQGFKITQLQQGLYCSCNYREMRIELVSDYLELTGEFDPGSHGKEEIIEIIDVENGRKELNLVPDVINIAGAADADIQASHLEYNRELAESITRCTRCLLPVTFPFIEFDTQGVCNYCHNYKIRNNPKSFDELIAITEPYRSKNGNPDCIVPFSGGRDSTYSLHIVKNKLKMNPIAFTYDWGMVTDLGRRNIARVCGKLGVENIIVAADIHWKRKNIRKNLAAWLRKPHLGMIPLLMAGDKYFYYYVDRVKKQTGIKLNLWGVNPMENTDFKVGFMGVKPDFEKRYIYSLSTRRQLKLISSLLAIIAVNPAYLNNSVPDTLGSFASRSLKPHRDYYHVFDYYKWDEDEIEDLIINEYNWERAIDTPTTWRIGDGTAAFYNYVYFTVAGFSEHDTFRSNQIREGVLSREEGLSRVLEENRPRYATIKWYLEAIGLDYVDVIEAVNAIPKLYQNERKMIEG